MINQFRKIYSACRCVTNHLRHYSLLITYELSVMGLLIVDLTGKTEFINT